MISCDFGEKCIAKCQKPHIKIQPSDRIGVVQKLRQQFRNCFELFSPALKGAYAHTDRQNGKGGQKKPEMRKESLVAIVLLSICNRGTLC